MQCFYSLFQVSILASLWRIISGDNLKTGDPKLEKLVKMVQIICQEFGNSLAQVSLNYIWLYKMLNNFGLIHLQSSFEKMFIFVKQVLTNQKEKYIDGNYTYNFSMLAYFQRKMTVV